MTQRSNPIGRGIDTLQETVGEDLTRAVGAVGRRLDHVTAEVTQVGRGVITSLPAEAVKDLVKGAVMFLRAAAATIVLGGVLIGLTTQLDEDTYLGFLMPYKIQILVAEVGLFGIMAVELLARAISQYLRSRGTQHAAFALRVALRATCYAVLVVAVVSMLAASPALAVGVGSVTGLIIGLSAQATVGNAVAGTVIALARPFRVGDEVTVMGVTGRVVEIAVMHTILDTKETVILVPSTTLMTQVVQRRKPVPVEPAQADSGGNGAAAPAARAGGNDDR